LDGSDIIILYKDINSKCEKKTKKTSGSKEPAIAHLVFKLTSKFHKEIQLILYFLPFEISAYSMAASWIKDHFSF
jgi:hypothetical protein